MDIQIYFDGELIFANLEIWHNGKSKTIRNLVVDTGAAKTFISVDSVDDLEIYFSNDDEIVSMYGIGGIDDSFRKRIDAVKFGNTELENYNLDFGVFKIDAEINGLIGLDLLKQAGITLDLDKMRMFQK